MEQKQIEFKGEILKTVHDQILHLSNKIEIQENKILANFQNLKSQKDQKCINESLRNLNQSIADQKQYFVCVFEERKVDNVQVNQLRQIIQDELQEIRVQQSTILQKIEQIENQQNQVAANTKKSKPEKCEQLQSIEGKSKFQAQNNEDALKFSTEIIKLAEQKTSTRVKCKKEDIHKITQSIINIKKGENYIQDFKADNNNAAKNKDKNKDKSQNNQKNIQRQGLENINFPEQKNQKKVSVNKNQTGNMKKKNQSSLTQDGYQDDHFM